MHRKQFQNIAIIFGGILIVLLQIILSNSLPGFTGTDDQSIEKIKEIAPNYMPWPSNVFEFTGEWSETVLFAIQASLGLGITIYYILKQRKKRDTNLC